MGLDARSRLLMTKACIFYGFMMGLETELKIV